MEPNFAPLKPSVVLGIAAHPDDIDVGASGTMATFAAAGASIHYLILTDGSKGSADPDAKTDQLVAMRQKEQRDALSVLGGKNAEFLSYPDGMLEITMDLKRDIVKAIRTVKPDVVVTMDPSVLYNANIGIINHPDHRAAGQATLDAVFPLARDHMSFPELFAAGYQPHKTANVLLNNFGQGNFYVDITDQFDKKMAAIAAHASQFPDMPTMQEMMTQMASSYGAKIGAKYAESFVRIDIR